MAVFSGHEIHRYFERQDEFSTLYGGATPARRNEERYASGVEKSDVLRRWAASLDGLNQPAGVMR